MTDTTTFDTPHVPLGVGRIIGDTFSVLYRKLHIVLVLGFIPALIELKLGNLMNGASSGAEGDLETFSQILAVVLLSWTISSIVTAAIVQMSYDARLNRPMKLGRYIAATIRNLPAIVVLSVVASLLSTLGLALLVVPGLWLYAVYSVTVPAIVIEGSGFRALGRSAELTRYYRWPVFLALALILLFVILITFVVVSVAPLTPVAFPAAIYIYFYVAPILEVAGSALSYGLVGIAVAMVFARLKEIKEGVGVGDLVEVFR